MGTMPSGGGILPGTGLEIPGGPGALAAGVVGTFAVCASSCRAVLDGAARPERDGS